MLCFEGLLGSRKRAREDEIKLPVSPGKVPVFVMLQLDWISDDGQSLRYKDDLLRQVKGLKSAGIKGVMADVWWGVCEPKPNSYRFGAALELCNMLKEVGMQLQAVMSFHQCGGNVGDTVSFPIPAWALEAAKTYDLLYKSRTGTVSLDCLSLSADQMQIFPSAGPEGKRTALHCYRDYVAAFAQAVGGHMGSTICELQVGMGPCGELRYPSYLMSAGWNFPGVGIVMAHDAGMLRMLQAETNLREPPTGLPTDQNAGPEATPLFQMAKPGEASTSGFRSAPGKTFLEWYSRVLINHGRMVLEAAIVGLSMAKCAPSLEALTMSVKVSGLHWHVCHPSRATEACAGYNCCSSESANAYAEIAKMLATTARMAGRPVLFNFTCMEMSNNSNGGMPHALSAPEDLIAQVRRACIDYSVPLAGENALEFDPSNSQWAFDQIEKQIRNFAPGYDRMHGITLLRLGETFVKPESLQMLARFVTRN
eukprot:TRINITY_DN710_c3_g1_i1.p1 TRINITY_DN710_c3_g1~~TRINITY_DN710_c3_g1_i1.p1  ORF type:complete len:480 (+),score=93.07 TRINITY_DN710_c3_g1_i1:52-1491(+)